MTAGEEPPPKNAEIKAPPAEAEAAIGQVAVRIERVFDELRLAVVGIVLAIAVAVGFGVEATTECWWKGVVAGLLTFPAVLGLMRFPLTKKLLTWYADVALDRKKHLRPRPRRPFLRWSVLRMVLGMRRLPTAWQSEYLGVSH